MAKPHTLMWNVTRTQPGGWDYVIQLWRDGNVGGYWMSYPDAVVRLTEAERVALIESLGGQLPTPGLRGGG